MENNSNEKISPLLNIFHSQQNKSNQLIPIIKDFNKIKNLITFFKSKENDINNKYENIIQLYSLFKLNISLIPYFIYNSKRNNLNLFYESIFDIYLNKEIKQDKEVKLENLIKLLITNVSLPKSAPEYLYQKMSKYFEKKNEIELDEELLMKYLKLLHLCYKDNSVNLNDESMTKKIRNEIINDFVLLDTSKIEEEKTKEVKNYMYFSGRHSFLSLAMNHNSKYTNQDFPSLENGCSFVFWLNLDENILKNYNNIYNLENNPLQINLILIKISDHQIKFILKDNKYFQLVIDKIESNLININTIFNFGKWVNICFVISKKTGLTQSTIKVYINGASNKSYLTIPKDFPIKEKINSIILFQNLIGRVSSLLFFSFPLTQKLINYFSLHIKEGIYKNKILFRFLLSNESSYFQNSINYKYYEKYNKEKNKDKLIDILLKDHNIKNIISVFTPFACNDRDNMIDDIFGNYIAILSKNDGVNNYTNHVKNIQIIGGINNFLPIAELMLKYKKSNNQNNLITERILLKYLNIFKDIIIGHSNNIFEANKNYFFSNLGLFLERFPSEIYTEKLLRILLDIGKEIFQYNDINNSNQNDNYINNILLNEKIFSKFSTENQVKLWDEVNKFFISDDSKMKESLNIYKICILLRFYDEKRYTEYCCKKHANIIKSKVKHEEKNKLSIKNIMNPEMNIKTEKLFEIIQIYINKLGTEEDTVNLYKLLLLDLSPCLQMKIIQVYINYFSCKNIQSDKKEVTLLNLLKKNYFEISEYALAISLLDVRIELLKLLKILYNNYREEIEDFFKNNLKRNIDLFFDYLGENLFPEQLLVEIDHNKKHKDDCDFISNKKSLPTALTIRKRVMSPINLNKKIDKFKGSFYEKNIIHKDRIPLIKYLNKDIYNKEKENLWNFLVSWVVYETKNAKLNARKFEKMNNFSIKYCLTFASKSTINYTISFLIFLYSYIKDEGIVNKTDLYSNKQLYSWIIEIIFYYHNEENIKNLNQKNDLTNITSIQIKSLDVLNFFFKNGEMPENEFEYLAEYVLDYSIYIKSRVNEENISNIDKKKKINEISRITSMLLLKCLEFSSKNINSVTRICFRYLIYYKNTQLTVDKETTFKFGVDEDDVFEILDKSSKVNIKFEKNDFNNNNIDDEDLGNLKINFIDNNKNSLIPSYIFETINIDHSKIENGYVEDNEDFPIKKYQSQVIINNLQSKNNYKPKKNTLLKDIWRDFSVYDYIIDYYKSNLWGIECLCKKVDIEYDNKPNELIQKLYNEYNDRKRYKKILLKPLLECFNIKKNEKKDDKIKKNIPKNNNEINERQKDFIYNENILTINLILLSIAIEITNDKDQLEFLYNQYQQLLIFLILSSINIKSTDKKYDFIQLELYNILGFGCLFLKQKNEAKYQQIIKYLVNPIFIEINETKDKNSLTKILTTSKKKIYSKTAVFKLFGTKENPKNDNNNPNKLRTMKTFQQSSINLRSNDFIDFENIINDDIFALHNKVLDQDIENNTDDNNDIVDTSNDDFEEIDLNNVEIKAELNVDRERRIDTIFNTVLTQYIYTYKNICQNITKIINKNNNNESLKREKRRVFNIVKILIPQYIEKLKKYSNSSYRIEKLRKNNYKKTKIKLFSWRGFWSNKYLFFTHPEYLKLKIKNHYTKDMIKPILTPVYDINYYLPEFKTFEKQKLFNKNIYNYNIDLDIDEILKYEVKENIINNNESFNSLKNQYGFNYLECLYRMPDEEIWNYYKISYEEKLNINKMVYRKKTDTSLILSNNTIKNNKKINHSFECCMVKITNHIKGHIITKNNYIEFIYDGDKDEEINDNSLQTKLWNLEDDLSYDKDLECCYGSMFKKHDRDREKIFFTINYEDIKYLFIKNYYYRNTAVEIFTENNKSYYFNFKNNNELLSFITDITKNDVNIKFRQISANIHDDKEKTKKIGYEKLLPNMKNKVYYISNKTEEWQNYNISTFEYLMWLNIYSGRSFNDLNQYPVFPWIITNYSSEEIKQNDFRNLETPIGMLEVNEKAINRKNVFISFYETLKEDFTQNYPDLDYQSFLNKGREYLESYKKKKLKLMKKDKNQIPDNNELDIPYNQIPYNYGTHYSNPTYTSHYLARIFPFSFVSIEIHGDKFDDPDRMFVSIEKTFESISSLKDDIREIIPEFYFLPEMFRNINNLNLAQDKIDLNGNKVVINDVDLPLWCKKNPINFIIDMRKYLENGEIHINKWIDIIFGSYQRGENAEKINNLFMSYTYENMINILEINDYEQRSALLRLYETGVTPRLLFKNDSKARIEKTAFIQKSVNSSLNFLEESIVLERNYLKMKKFNLLCNKNSIDNKDLDNNNNINLKIIKILIKNNDKLLIFTNANHYFDLKTQKEKEEKEDKNTNTLNLKNQKIFNFDNTSITYAPSYQISSIEMPVIIYNNNKLMLKGGFWDGRIEINTIPSDSKEESESSMIFTRYGHPIVCMKMAKDEKLLICGTKDGCLIIYDVNAKDLKIKDIIYSHSNEITSISINDSLNMFATTSVDGYINLHILPSLQLFRVIHISSLKLKNKKVNDENNINKINIIEEEVLEEEIFEEYKEEECLYAENVFLSSSPLACVVIFILNKKIFKTFTINGELINEIKETEGSSKIYSSIIYKNMNFNDFLIYGTNNGCVKIRSFPNMELINCIKISDSDIKTLALSNDKRICYTWEGGENLSIINDNIISGFQEI